MTKLRANDVLSIGQFAERAGLAVRDSEKRKAMQVKQ